MTDVAMVVACKSLRSFLLNAHNVAAASVTTHVQQDVDAYDSRF